MSQHYSDPSRENDPHALPNVEVFHSDWFHPEEGVLLEGWYWWACFPGCLPDSEPNGPFETEAEAVADAQDGSEHEDH